MPTTAAVHGCSAEPPRTRTAEHVSQAAPNNTVVIDIRGGPPNPAPSEMRSPAPERPAKHRRLGVTGDPPSAPIASPCTGKTEASMRLREVRACRPCVVAFLNETKSHDGEAVQEALPTWREPVDGSAGSTAGTHTRTLGLTCAATLREARSPPGCATVCE
mmetsp:Transcript_20955/g.58653  ORF Transcript_20955/g.58653 Transcript_20955/m.58653 type:complete len:161 (+) Transcript_20955:56-538(+)